MPSAPSGSAWPGATRLSPQVELAVASPWCQRWRSGRHSWRHRSEGGFDRDRYVVRGIPESDARDFILRHHYSRSMPAARFTYGLHDLAEDGSLVGAAVLSVPVRAEVLIMWNTSFTSAT
jgi:hypothetical protein